MATLTMVIDIIYIAIFTHVFSTYEEDSYSRKVCLIIIITFILNIVCIWGIA